MTDEQKRIPKRIHMAPLRPFEDRLLNALATFRFKRSMTTQANHCLSMYLRQAYGRIMEEVGFYANWVGMEPLAFLEFLYQEPEKAISLIESKNCPDFHTLDDPLLNGEIVEDAFGDFDD